MKGRVRMGGGEKKGKTKNGRSGEEGKMER